MVQVAWVNSQGLFVLGPIVLVFGLIDAALRFGIFAPERRRWWKLILVASVATGLACLINPYGIKGALYPIELAGTMSNPIFSRNVAELTSIADFHRKATDSWRTFRYSFTCSTMLLGGLSFLIPLGLADRGLAAQRPGTREHVGVPDRPATADTETPGRATRNDRDQKRGARRPRLAADRRFASTASRRAGGSARFDCCCYAAFSFLSLQATRNSHQFAAVVGTVTAWNFGEWAAAIRKRRQMLRRVRRRDGRFRLARWRLPRSPCCCSGSAAASFFG